MTYTICNIDKMILTSVTNNNLKMVPYQSHQYDLVYMFQRYSLNPESFIQWFIKKMNLTGNEVALELGCFSKIYWTHNLEYAQFFQKLYLVDEKIDNILQAKRILKKYSNVNMTLHHSEGLDIENQTVDLVYSSNLDLKLDCYHPSLLSEVIRVLKADGTFYYTHILEDYYASIYRLLEEYDLNLYVNQLLSRHLQSNIQEVEQLLASTFSTIESSEYQTQWMVDNVDDLIGFILCDPEFKDIKNQIFKSGISKFRAFLQNKIEKLGGISVIRRVIVISCTQKRIYS